MRNVLFYVFFLALFACNNNQNKPVESAKEKVSVDRKIFELVDDSISGITFSNSISPKLDTNENLFDFDYFYNGSGVGIADLNNDGLGDLFFCANQVDNTLYINKGELKFDDVSEKSDINKSKGWSNGVTFVDINNDGWTDIYVSQGGPIAGRARENMLLINQKNGSFADEADLYGLADAGLSTQSVFFDFDNDKDLDCLVLNENDYYGVDPVNFNNIFKNNPALIHANSSHLYENIGGRFVDITEQSGLLSPTFGLGVVVLDVNDDGWLDIYTTNDYYLPDVLYVNNKEGGFDKRTKEYFKQLSFYGMGVDVADINNDTLEDIFVLDMASSDHFRSKTLMASMSTENFDLLVDKLNFPHQYMFNSLQVKNKFNSFNNVSQLTKTAKTDWSWSGLMADFDNDGFKDIYVTNGYRKYALDNDLRKMVFEVQKAFAGKVPLDVKKKLYDRMPSEKLSNVMFKNYGDFKFNNVAYNWGLAKPSFSNGAAYGDLDNDGDLDLVVNNIDDKAFLWRNTSSDQKLNNWIKVIFNSNSDENFNTVKIYGDNLIQSYTNRRVRGYLSTVEEDLVIGIGSLEVVDSISVVYQSGRGQVIYNVSKNSVINVDEENSSLIRPVVDAQKDVLTSVDNFMDYNHNENRYDDFKKEILLPYKQSSLGPFTSTGDVNSDGYEDIYVSGSKGNPGALFLNDGKKLNHYPVSSFINDSAYEDMGSVFFDIDNDGDLDLYVVSGGNEFSQGSRFYIDRVYLNNGEGDFIRDNNQQHLQKFKYSGKVVKSYDFDNDGDQDILVGNRIIPQNYPVAAPSILFENNSGLLIPVSKQIFPDLIDIGIVNDIELVDIDKDGKDEVVLATEWGGVYTYTFKDNEYVGYEALDYLRELNGMWFSISSSDFNQDGYVDLVLGNLGLNSKYKASKTDPLRIYAKDFDDNGSLDIVLSYKYQNEFVPLRGRECSAQQMPFINEKFETYQEFASSSLYDIYGNDLNNAYQKELDFLESIVIYTNESSSTQQSLPVLAQSFPILDSKSVDLNADQISDLIIVGNIYDTEVETPRLDMGSGMILFSDIDSGFDKINYLNVSGNVKHLSILKQSNLNDEKMLLFFKNDDPVYSFKIKE